MKHRSRKKKVNEDEFVRNHLQVIAKTIAAQLPDDWSFFLLCAPNGERKGRANYVSKMTRESAIACMREFIAKTDDVGFGTHEP